VAEWRNQQQQQQQQQQAHGNGNGAAVAAADQVQKLLACNGKVATQLQEASEMIAVGMSKRARLIDMMVSLSTAGQTAGDKCSTHHLLVNESQHTELKLAIEDLQSSYGPLTRTC
jgi:hypothetical protein